MAVVSCIITRAMCRIFLRVVVKTKDGWSTSIDMAAHLISRLNILTVLHATNAKGIDNELQQLSFKLIPDVISLVAKDVAFGECGGTIRPFGEGREP